ncbi:MAG: SUMF1/EgtB/PvdO family nonheme iron enzyme [Candidatus Margulisiibacteriota bacterium]
MVTPVTNKSIIHLSQRALPALRGVASISSFAICKDNLAPCLTKLFQRQEIKLIGIQLDTAAKVRLLGMRPDLATRTVAETPEAIFASLGLSAFLTQDKQLYILGDKQNDDLMVRGAIPPAAAGQPQIALPEMVPISDGLMIMKYEVTVSLFKRVMAGYSFEGAWSKELRKILADPEKEGGTLTWASLDDAVEFARKLSDLTGRQFRLPTEEEWEAVTDDLFGSNWEWTMTQSAGASYEKPSFVLRCRGRSGRDNYIPWERFSSNAIRLVEVLPIGTSATVPSIMDRYINRTDDRKTEDLANWLRFDLGHAAFNLASVVEHRRAVAALSLIDQADVNEILKTMIRGDNVNFKVMPRIMHQLAVNHTDYALPLFQRLADDSACVVVAVQDLLPKEASELLGVFLREVNGMERIASLLARCPKKLAELIEPYIEVLKAASDLSEIKSS